MVGLYTGAASQRGSPAIAVCPGGGGDAPEERGEKSGRTAGRGLPGASQGSRLACGAPWHLTEARSCQDWA
ncbi:hypothetical protein NDU88_002487 [Pleurodeles waltl]|uniref:Uncharacterized protein n=1 Tax=Pleurodeles waltl TaxID=8319 RepID=A0AAV7LCM2_PLEWA|nr:hypothetical protein NDU88_002487 [Pleurodeles waltl]